MDTTIGEGTTRAWWTTTSITWMRGSGGNWALVACRTLVDRWLAENHKPSMTGAELYGLYTSFGEDPFILNGEGGRDRNFSAWEYAKDRAEALCSGS